MLPIKATFEEFISQNPNYKRFANDKAMQKVFAYLSEDEVIMNMIDSCESGKSALEPVVEKIEQIFSEIGKQSDCTLNDTLTKQGIGRMVKTILNPFGYTAFKQRHLPKRKGAAKTPFQTGALYIRDNTKTATMRVVKYIEEVKSTSKRTATVTLDTGETYTLTQKPNGNVEVKSTSGKTAIVKNDERLPITKQKQRPKRRN